MDKSFPFVPLVSGEPEKRLLEPVGPTRKARFKQNLY